MPEQFLHGIEVVEIDTGTRPIRTVRSSVIGLVGTAPDADAAKFPLNTPVLIAGKRSDAAGLGATGTLPGAIDGIFDQAGAMIVLIRVEEGADEAATLSNLIGGIDDDSGQYLGVQALLAAESEVHLVPRILIAPGFTQQAALVSEMVSIATRLGAMIIADGPNSNDADAIAYRNQFDSARVYLCDPWVRVWDTDANAEVVQPASARIAGVWAKSDAERGFWHSPSNRVIDGITGAARSVDYALGDPNSRANYLNEHEVSTIINYKGGYRAFGNRTLSSNPKWAFVKRRRIADMVNISIQRAHFWALDRNADKQYFENVVDGVNAYGQHLINIGALVGFKYWASELNTPEQLEAGKVYFDYDWVETPTAEHITFRSIINNGYLSEVVPTA